MEVLISFIILIAFLGGSAPLKDIPKDEISISFGPGIEMRQGVKPLTEFTDANLVKQEYDFSCGSAALATLMDYYLGEDFTEEQVIKGLLEYGDKALIQKRRAFSLLDMKRFVNVLGYRGVGYKAEIDDLKTLGMPCIIPIVVYQYKHFVVLKGIYDGHIFFADPYLGNTSFTLSEFKKIWYENIAFVVYPREGEKGLNALKLKDSDLRIVSLGMTREALPPRLTNTRDLALEQQKMLEATGKYQFYRR